MTTYIVGDIHGCVKTLSALVDQINPSDSDAFVLLGDYVNKGPDSVGVIRLCQTLPHCTHLLGNHDVAMIAGYYGEVLPDKHVAFQQIMSEPDHPALFDWLMKGRLCYVNHEANFCAVHAGIWPTWQRADCERIDVLLQQFGWHNVIAHGRCYPHDSRPADGTLSWLMDALTITTNLRYTDCDGACVWGRTEAPPQPGLVPWYQWPRKLECPVYFGHWATLTLPPRPDAIHLDGGVAYKKSLRACAHETGEIYSCEYQG